MDQSPPVRAALDLRVPVAGGTDSTRIGVAGVWQAIEYHIGGRAIGDSVRRPREDLITREEALSLYTRQAAWLTFTENNRGQLKDGMLADLAVLDQPLLSMPVDRIHTIRSVLTLLGGRAVHQASGADVANEAPVGAIQVSPTPAPTTFEPSVAFAR